MFGGPTRAKLPAMTETTQPTDTFQQISVEIAEAYEANFVPSVFAGLADQLVSAAGIAPGQRVLDVACGTGIVARTAADRAGEHGHVSGMDLNDAMLTVARRLRPDLDWRQGNAATLPFPDASYDAVLCQSGLMFVPDVAGAVREMARVTADGGTVGVQVWSSLDRQPGFQPLADAVARHAGRDAVDLVTTYFRLGDRDELAGHFAAAGLHGTIVRSIPLTLHAPSVDAYVTTEVESTPLLSRISDEVYRRIREDVRTGLAPFCDDSGGLALPSEVYLVIARKG
jgi:ubiquinone/menaquinone biosynthesis C-methylase UbiE